MKQKNLKEMEGSRLLIRKIVSKFTDEQGNTHIQTKWFVSPDPVNLGSVLEKKNEDIVEYKYEFPPENVNIGNIFGKLFGGSQ